MTRDQEDANQSTNRSVNQRNHQATNSNHHSSKSPFFETFELHSNNDDSLEKAIKLVENLALSRNRICVISIISKASISDSAKDYLVRSLYKNSGTRQKQRQTSLDTPKTEEHRTQSTSQTTSSNLYENQVTGHLNTKSGIVVLNLTSFLDTNHLMNIGHSRSVPNDGSPHSQLMDNWPKLNQNLMKTLLLLSVLSHVVVFYNPEPSIDYSLIQILKVLDILRTKSQARISDLLGSIAAAQTFSQQWVRQARIACPRALFVCDISSFNRVVESGELIELKRELEDQIHRILKKSNITSRSTSHNYLLQLSERGDFVFVITRQDLFVSNIERQVDQPEAPAKNIYPKDTLWHIEFHEDRLIEAVAQHDLPKRSLNSNVGKNHNKFKKFLMRHVSDVQALAQADQENKHNHRSNQILLPRCDDFFAVMMRLKNLLFPKVLEPQEDNDTNLTDNKCKIITWPAPDERQFIDVYEIVNIDELFSKCYCLKARLAAYDLYLRTIQQQSDDSESNPIKCATDLFVKYARGPYSVPNMSLLLEQCNRHQAAIEPPNKNSSRNSKYLGNFSRAISDFSHNKRYQQNQSTSTNRRGKPDILLTRRSDGVKVICSCDCGRKTNLIVAPVNKTKKLERVNVHYIDD